MGVDVFCSGVGEHTQHPGRGRERCFGKGGWWCLSHVSGAQPWVMLEKLRCSNPALLLEIESQEFFSF